MPPSAKQKPHLGGLGVSHSKNHRGYRGGGQTCLSLPSSDPDLNGIFDGGGGDHDKVAASSGTREFPSQRPVAVAVDATALRTAKYWWYALRIFASPEKQMKFLMMSISLPPCNCSVPDTHIPPAEVASPNHVGVDCARVNKLPTLSIPNTNTDKIFADSFLICFFL